MGKFGKHSCCGRGGSWFENCGSRGNTKLAHTWYEGIQACKTSLEQSKLELGQPQPNRGQQKRNHSSKDVGSEKKEITTTTFATINTPMPTPTTTGTNIFISASVNILITPSTRTAITHTSTHILPPTAAHSSLGMPIMLQGCETLLKTVVHTIILFFIVF